MTTHAGQPAADQRRDSAAVNCAMLVGSRTLTDALASVFDEIGFRGEVVAAEGYLVALADAPRALPDVVMGNLDGLSDEASLVAHAFREINPNVKLVLLVWPEEMEAARRAVTHGFDEYLVKPVDATALARALSGASRRAPTPPAQQAPPQGQSAAEPAPPSPEPAADVRSAEQVESSRQATSSPQHAQAPAADVEPAVEPSTTREPRRDESPQPANADLGDIDLIDALLSTRDPIVDKALELVRGQSGYHDIDWASPDERIHVGRVVAPVKHRHTVFGRLHAGEGITEAELDSWAAWLSHWVALQTELTELRRLAYTDELTGVWNRRYFNRMLERLLERAKRDRFRVTVMVYDIDNFKSYNDRYGHAAGDEILRETARLMKSTIREHDIVARIGGDEFAVIFWDAEEPRRPNSRHPESVKAAARRFQHAVVAQQFPKLLNMDETITISGGLAGYPWDAQSSDHLLAIADQMALQSKANGKNAITFGPGALRVSNGDSDDQPADASP